ncbi:MAG: HAMP domain-containing histidine kinase [Burkholderiales bacterium]|nr:HAMP domain-containing histidine kinase [Burkholderiales bacterium]
MRPKLAGLDNLALVLALGLLLAAAAGHAMPWRAPLFLAHLGAVLWWQPLVPGDRRVSWRAGLFLGAAAVALAFIPTAWIELVWTALFGALVAGRGFASRHAAQRRLLAAALVFLAGFMFMLVVPSLLPAGLAAGALPRAAATWVLTVLLALVALLAMRPVRADVPRDFDVLYASAILFGMLLVAFFGIAVMTLTQRGYAQSMAITLATVAGLLLSIGLLRRASGGAGGTLAIGMSRYLLSYSLPHEVWLERLAGLNRDEADARRFFAAAMAALCESGVVVGVRWNGAGTEGVAGATSSHVESLDLPVPLAGSPTIRLVVASTEPMAPSHLWHVRLLARLAVEFYGAKAREERLRAQQYLRAVHETGARVTHDVKNLLQSLKGLIGASAVLREDRAMRALIERQLPVIEQRLSATLSKLESPDSDSRRLVALSVWWEGLARQYASQGVEVAPAQLALDLPVPAPVFDSAADNFLQNALQKRALHAGLAIRASLSARDGEVEFAVTDDGEPLAAGIADALFEAPVASANGLGIGLYQSAQLARAAGYQVSLSENRPGCVRFVLLSRASGMPRATAAGRPPA